MTTLSRSLNILYIPTEFSTWHAARSWSYSVQLALEEGFGACRANVVTLPAIRGLSADMPTSWLRHASRLLRNNSFDQVWIELVHNNPGDRFLEWLKDVAPIRVGLVGESLDYEDDAILLHPHLAHRRAVVEGRLRFMTHTLFADECDAELAEQSGITRGLWWPQAVPERCITVPSEQPEKFCALFAGIAYGQREKWLSDPELTGLIEKVRSSEHYTCLPGLFDTVQSTVLKQLEEGFVPELEHLNSYVDMLRQIRRRCFEHWLHTLQQGNAVINLPSFVKAYAGRVVEGMAAGRPVISWRIPHRPKIDELFVSGTEILHYSASNPAELAAQIRYLIEKPDAGRQIAEMARLKLALHHTVEIRVGQIMEWLKHDLKPDYSGVNNQTGDISVSEFGRAFGIEISLESLAAKALNNNRESEVIDDVQISTFIAANEQDKAIACLEPSGYYPEVKGMLAHLHLAAGNVDAAAHLIYQAVADEPGNADYLLDAAELALKRSDRKNTRFYLDEAGRLLLNEQQSIRLEQLFNSLDSLSDDQSTLVGSFIAETIKAAKSLALQGQVDGAVDKLLNRGIKADPSSPLPYIELAEILLAAERYEDALQVLPEMPPETDRELMCEIEAICRAALGDNESARQAANRSKERSRSLVVLGTLAARSEDLEKAEALFRLAADRDPSCGAAWLSLGMLQWGKGNQEDAYQAVRRAVTVDPLNIEAVKILLDIAGRHSLQDDALQIISDAAQLYPESRNLARHHAELLVRCGKEAEALDGCETFLSRFGVEDELLSLALQLRLQIGAYDRLAGAWDHSISLCMIVKNEENHLPACLASLKPVVDEMIVVDTGSTDRTADIAAAFGARVCTFAWNGNFSDARNCAIIEARGKWVLVMDADEVLAAQDYEAVRDSVRESAGKKIAWSVLTRNYTARVNAQGWISNDGGYPLEERADGWHPSWKVRLFPNQPSIRFNGEVHEMVENSLLMAGYTINKASFVVHHYGGLVENSEEVAEKGRRYFEIGMKKLEKNPNDGRALAELAVQAGEIGSFEEAVRLWDRLLAIAPDNVEAMFNKGYALIKLQRHQEALAISQKVLELEPGHKEAAFNYGTSTLYVGKPPEAILKLEPLLQQYPEYPPLLAVLTLLYLLSGQREKAVLTNSKLRELNYAVTDYAKARADALIKLGKEGLARKLLDECAAIGMDVL